MSTKTKVVISPLEYQAVIFDLDGVITKTATVHGRAWKRMFDEFLQQHSRDEGVPFVPFDEQQDYLTYVDGKPRYDGIQSFLESRGIDLEWGDPSDGPHKVTICGLADKKNRLFLDELKNGIEVYQSTVAIIRELRERGVKTGIISSSKNCTPILEKVGLLDVFDTKIDGLDQEKRGIPGKPSPDVFLQAARELEVKPEHAVVVEDAISGVQSGSAGGFGLVIGIDRVGQEEELIKNGATIVVNDMNEVKISKEVPKNAIKAIGEIRDKMVRKQSVLFFDYDGTLTPIVAHPDLAVMSDEMRDTLERLSKFYTIAIISGRDRPNVESFVNLKGIFYAGSHGFDIQGPKNQHYENDEGIPFLSVLNAAEVELSELLQPIEGAWMERKKYSIAAHYRQTPEDQIPKVEEAVDQVHSNHPKLRKALGKKIFELQPNIDWNKGKALHYLLELLNLEKKDVLPFYFGDDVTDEDAFKEIKKKGIGISVQETFHETAASYTLKDPHEVQYFLQLLISEADNG